MKINFKWFKNIFIPHKDNEYKPHFFREYFLGVFAILAIFLFGASLGGSLYVKNKNLTAAVLPAVLVDLTNKDRIANGQVALKKSSILEKAAQMKAEDMVENQYFAHTSPKGLTPWYFINKAGYTFIYAGENLAVDFTESVDVENAWMLSPKHRENIVDSRFTEIGIAAKEGYLDGNKTIFVVQMFGHPAYLGHRAPVLSENIKENILDEVPLEKIDAEILEGNVKGQSTLAQNLQKTEVMVETPEFITAKSPEYIEDANSPIPDFFPTYKVSGWQKFLYKSSYYIDFIYEIMLYISLLAMVLFVGIEIKRQHPKNILYGSSVILLIIVLFYINKVFFLSPGLV